METIQDYKILEKIDETQGSHIYRARKEGEERSVIIKLLKTEYPSISKKERFKREYHLIRNLDFDGVIKVYELIEFSGKFALVLEDFKGIHLGRVRFRDKGEMKTFLGIAIALSRTLGSLHKENIVHMDIKPLNILVNTQENIVKITDFGISSIITDAESDMVGGSMVGGTLAYMSPEQTGRMNRNIDYRSDFYSLGVTFYEILTGRLPFISNDPMEIVHAHIAVQPESPGDINPGIPAPVSDIVLKLMAKTAEERYQNGFGLMADLERCYDCLVATGDIQQFPLGEKDVPLKFNLPQRIQGRDHEISELISAFGRCTDGNAEVLLVSGSPGIGKSALINEIHKPIVAGRGMFGVGKYEQFRRDVPYSAIISAFQGLIRQLLSEKKDVIDMWKVDILKAVGENGKLIIRIVPDLEFIIGPQPDVPVLGPTESRNRFDYVFSRFVRVFAQKTHPLALFLDDLQWADPASLHFIKKLMLDPELKYMLLISSYRDIEMDAAHPAMITLNEMMSNGVRCSLIKLSPLNAEDVTGLISDFLKYGKENVSDLAAMICVKTGGNPFFINQFLKVLYERGGIEPVLSGWQWDREKIRKMQLTDNVVDLLAEKITQLSERSTEILKVCACIGNQFDLETLAMALSLPIHEILPDLGHIMQEGYVSLTENEYVFHHDRIREAAYSLIPENRKMELHYKIGKLTLEKCNDQDLEKKVFYILSHLNQCIDIISDKEEMEILVRLNLQAGIKAKSSSAYSSAWTYLQTGMSLLGEGRWEIAYDMTRDFHLNAAEAACLIGNFSETARLCASAKEHITDVLDLSRFSEIEIISYSAQDRLKEVVTASRDILKKLNVTIPENPTRFHVLLYLIKVRNALKRKPVETLVDLQEMTDPYIIQAMRIIVRISTSIYHHNQDMMALIILKGVLLSLKYGNTPASAPCYITYGIILAGALYDFDRAYKLGELSFKLLHRFSNKEYRPNCLLATGFIRIWKVHFREVIPELLEGYKIGLETGNFEIGANSAFMYTGLLFAANKNLHELEPEINKFLKALGRLNQNAPYNYMSMDMQAVQNLMGRSQDPCNLKGEYYDIEKMLLVHKEVNDYSAISYAYCNAQQISYLFGDYEKSLEYAKLLKTNMVYLSGSPSVPRYFFYYSLVLLALYGKVDRRKKSGFLNKIKTNQMFLKRFGNACPENFLSMYTLVEAEKARVLGEFVTAEKYYADAVALFKEQGFIMFEALANELAAGFYLSMGLKKIAGVYIQESLNAYSYYGAEAKVDVLDKKYHELMNQFVPGSSVSEGGTTGTLTTVGSTSRIRLDLSSVLKASQAISGEIVLGKLLERMMWIAMENAGAQRGVFILENNGEFFVEAEGGTEMKRIKVLQSIPVDTYSDISSAIVSYVLRSKKTLILNDASSDMNFISDPYILRNKPKSVLCAPALRQGKLLGILYLENNLSSGAFTPDRMELLRVLSSQAVISIENARLYANLETKVRERTAELQQARDALWGEMELARKIQSALLPEAPAISGFEISAYMAPANEVGGDYYDIINVQDKHWVIIGDVSGHGVPAGLVMMMAQTAIKSVLNENPDIKPTQLLTAINRTITDNIRKLKEDKYMTMTALAYNDQGRFYFSGLHQDILVYRAASGHVESIETNGCWIGMMDDISGLVTDESLTLNIGDTMLMFTDGITEALEKNSIGDAADRKPAFFGSEQLLDILKKSGAASAEEVKNRVVRALDHYDCPDDVTLVVVKRTA